VTVSNWRIVSALDDRGLMCYFDPYLEDISIRVLTAPERAARLDRSGKRERVEETETEPKLGDQIELLKNGS